MVSYTNADIIYKKVLSDIQNQGIETEYITDDLSIGSHFGKNPRKTKEILGYKFDLTNPHARIVSNQVRCMNLSFAVANFVWNLSASDDLEKINFFNGRGISFSDNGKTIDGSCYGKRLFNAPNGLNQIRAIIEKIKQDPSSRRTFAPIFYPEDNFVNTKDVPCPIGVQYFLRNHKLHAITYMRSNSAAFVLPYNIFFFTMIQELIAKELHSDLGEYMHICGSIHYYDDEEEFVERIVSSPLPDKVEMSPMPDTMNLENIEILTSIQADFVLKSKENTVSYWINRAEELHPYWANFAYVILAYGFEKFGKIEESRIFTERLDPIYKIFSKKIVV